MDISSYRAESLLGPRDATRDPPKTPIAEISAIAGANTGGAEQATEEDGLSLFETLLDTVNPLQHIPGVSTAYRAITGDESNAFSNMAGGFLFGGPVGLAAGAASSFFEMVTGNDVVGHAMALFKGEPDAAGIEHLASETDIGPRGLLHPGTPLSVEHYQAFASAQATQNKGYGADNSQVSWSSNIWTANALKEATSLYENNQELGQGQSNAEQRQQSNQIV